MQIHAQADTDPQIARRKCCKYQIFLLIFKISLQPQHLPKLKRGHWKKKKRKKHLGHFLINMQMPAIRFVGWIELISATSFACAVITNYRQASDRQLRPRMPSNGPFTSRGIVESTRTVSWKKRGSTYTISSAGTLFYFNLIHRSLIMKYLQSDSSVLIHLQHNRELESQTSQ